MSHFTPALFRFLRDLEKNNTREWFVDHRDRYERDVREPARKFIAAIAPRLKRLSPNLVADPRLVGGSLFRLARDPRFASELGPYKTAVGMAFGLGGRGDSNSPALYLYLAPRASWAGGGVRSPQGAVLAKLRAAIATDPSGWEAVVHRKGFSSLFPSNGGTPERQRTFMWRAEFSDREVCGEGFLGRYLEACRLAAPFNRFVAGAVGRDW